MLNFDEILKNTHDPQIHKVFFELKDLDFSNAEKIISFFQKEDNKGNRNIDILISALDTEVFDDFKHIHDLFEMSNTILSKDNWLKLLTTQPPNKNNPSAFGLWVKNGCPYYPSFVNLFIFQFEQDTIVKLLKQTVEGKDKIPISFLTSQSTNTVWRALKRLKELGKLNDQLIKEILESPAGTNYLDKCDSGILNNLSALITEEKIKNEFNEYLKKYHEKIASEKEKNTLYLGTIEIAKFESATKDNAALYNIVSKLKKLDTQDIKSFLLEEDKDGNRNIDIIISHIKDENKDIYNLFDKISDLLGKKDWFELLTTPSNKNKTNAFELWVKNACQPTSYAKVFLKVGKVNLLKLLTHVVTIQNPITSKPDSASCLTWFPNTLVLPLLKWLKEKENLSDEEIMEAVRSPVGRDAPQGENFLIKCIKLDESNSKSITISELRDLFDKEDAKAELDDYVKNFKLRRKATHFLGGAYVDTVYKYDSVTDSKTKVEKVQKISYEGMSQAVALEIFTNRLNEYHSVKFSEEFKKIKDAFNTASVETSEEVINKYKTVYDSGKPIIIPSGWSGHSVTIGVVNRYLVVANRGEGRHVDGGCIIYKLKEDLTAAQMQQFQECKDQKLFFDHVQALVQPDYFKALPLKPQKYGTCSIANKKGVVAGILFVLAYIKNGKEYISPEVEESARKEYKNFTSTVNDLTLNEILIELDDPNKVNSNEIIEALCEFCNEHTNLQKESEATLLKKIYEKMQGIRFYRGRFVSGLSPAAQKVMNSFETINKALEIAKQFAQSPIDELSHIAIDIIWHTKTSNRYPVNLVNKFAKKLNSYNFVKEAESLSVEIAKENSTQNLGLNKILDQARFFNNYSKGALATKSEERQRQINLIKLMLKEINKDKINSPCTKANIAFTIFDLIGKNIRTEKRLFTSELMTLCDQYKNELQSYVKNSPPLGKAEIMKLLPNLKEKSLGAAFVEPATKQVLKK